MAWYEDLTPIDYFGPECETQLRAVGWLESDHGFSTHELLPEFPGRLADMLADPWQPCFFGGFHDCSFCRLIRGPYTIQLEGPRSPIDIGISNLYVPGDGFLYVAPSMILHYITGHNYGPPEAFQRAVIACPEMRSMDYLKAIKKNGPPFFWRTFR